MVPGLGCTTFTWSSPQPSEGTAALLILQLMTLRVKGQAHGWDSDPAPKLCSELCTALPHPFPIPVVPTWCQGTAGASKLCAGGAAPGGGQVEGTVFPHSLSLLYPSFLGRPLSWGRARPREDLDGAPPLSLCRPGASVPVPARGLCPCAVPPQPWPSPSPRFRGVERAPLSPGVGTGSRPAQPLCLRSGVALRVPSRVKTRTG